jgi:hypothetical protein
MDRRARPSSGSTEIDAFLLDRRAVARQWRCARCNFIFCSSFRSLGQDAKQSKVLIN